MPRPSSDEARAAVTAALEARRARPALKVPLGVELSRPLDTKTSLGLLIALLGVGAAIAVQLGVEGDPIGWILGAVVVAVTALGLAKDWAVAPHNIRVSRHLFRQARVTKRWIKADRRYRAGDVRRVMALRQWIIDGGVESAATGVLLLFKELAGDDALSEEVIHKRQPIWPAWLYFYAFKAELDGDEARAIDLFEQTLATEDPIWATAAAVGLLGHLNESTHPERVDALKERLLKHGDPGVVTELVHYR